MKTKILNLLLAFILAFGLAAVVPLQAFSTPVSDNYVTAFSLPGETTPATISTYKAGWITENHDSGTLGTWTDNTTKNYDAAFQVESGATVYEKNLSATTHDNFGGTLAKAQSFVPADNHTVTAIELSVVRIGNPAGDVVVSIRNTDSEGRPTGSDLVSATKSCASITDAEGNWTTFEFGAGISLTAGTRYAICMRAASATDYFWGDTIWYAVSKTNPYPTGIIDATVPFGTDLTNLVASYTTDASVSSVTVNSVSQTSGVTPNNFSSKVTYTFTATDNTTQHWDVTVHVAPNDKADILSFSLNGQTGSSVDNVTHSVTVNVPYATNLTNLIATFSISPNATIRVGATPQVSGFTPNDFSDNVTYVVTSENTLVTQPWTVSVITNPPSTAADFLTYSLAGQTGSSVDNVANTVTVNVPYATDLTNLVATFTTSPHTTSIYVGATPQVSGATSNNFSSPLVYRITAENTSVYKDWTVTVIKNPPDTEADFLNFSLPGQVGQSTIIYNSGWVTASYDAASHWADVYSRAYDAVFKEGNGATVYESNTSSNNYDNFGGDTLKAQSFIPSVNHTVTNIQLMLEKQGAPTGNVTVTIRNTDANGLPIGSPLATGQIPCDNITLTPAWYQFDLGAGVALNTGTRYAICMQASSAVGTPILYAVSTANPYPNGTVDITVSYPTDLANLIATFTISPLANSIKINGISQVSGVTANNFSSPITYVITGQGGNTSTNWIVTVTKMLPSTAAEILTYSLPGQTSANLNSGAGTINVTVNYNITVTSLIASFTTSPFSSIKVDNVDQISGSTANNFSNPITYVVTAQDGITTKTWVVTVTVTPYSGGGNIGGGTGGASVTGPGVTSLGLYTNSQGLFNIAAIVKSEDGNIILDIAKGVLALDKDNSGLKSIKIVPLDTQPTSTAQNIFVGLAYEITPEGATFSPAITLTIHYDPTKLPKNIDINSLTIAVFNSTTGEWQPIQSVPNKTDATISATIAHFSKYAVIGKAQAPAPTVTPTQTQTPTKTVTPTTSPTKTVTPTTTPAKTTTAPTTAVPTTSSNNIWLWIIGVVVLGVIAGVIGWFVARRRKNK